MIISYSVVVSKCCFRHFLEEYYIIAANQLSGFKGVHLTLPPPIFSVQVNSGACYVTGQWVASSE